MSTQAEQQRPVHVERGTGDQALDEEEGAVSTGAGEEATPGATRKPTEMSTPKGGRKGHLGGEGPDDPDGDYPDDDQSVRTSEIERQLRHATRQVQHPRTEGSHARQVGLTQIKLKTFNKGHAEYKAWKKNVEAQQALYDPSEKQMAMIMYLAMEGEAKDTVDQMTITEMSKPGGLQRVWKLLEEAFGLPEEDKFEKTKRAYENYVRPKGCSISTYIVTLKRLKKEYLIEDPGTKISEKA